MSKRGSGREMRGDIEMNAAALRETIRKYGWLYRIRPQSLAEPLYRLVAPSGGRAIVEVSGAKAYVDPFSTSGRIIIDEGSYEPELVELMRRKLAPGGVFVDIGANEGLFSAIAASIVGDKGLVIAVEPQSRLRDVLEINIALNNRGSYRIYRNVIGEEDGLELSLSLGPSSHTGGSSLVRAYRWSKRTEKVASRTVDSILAEQDNPHVDLMKIDVEGYEPEVVNSAAATLAAKRIKAIAVDYHGSILSTRGIDPRAVDEKIRAHGYRLEAGSPEGGYCVYSV